jgi:outer membrane lipoprotein-sorting protein
MKFLRTVSTRRLLAMIAGLVTAIAAGTAIAVAAVGSGPVPAPKPLAQAIHDAVSQPAPQGISARISFTNHLFDSSDIQGIDPLLTGASGRLWLSKDRLRVELQGDNGDAQLVVNRGSFWVYDPGSKTVYEGQVPQSLDHGNHRSSADQLPSVQQIQSFITRLMGHANVSGAIPSDVAGQPAYTVRISPKHDSGLLGAGELAWDALRGVPLRIALYARNDSAPVLELKATDISYSAVPASVFSLSWPSGAKVVKLGSVRPGAAAEATRSARGRAEVSGEAAVAKRLTFKLSAPAELASLPRQEVRLLGRGTNPGALVTYGEPLGGVAVIEQPVDASNRAPLANGDEHGGLHLPSVSINGASGQQLDTALGTVVRFTRGGVTYTVLGSVPPAVADAAARAL